jgi:hypothetical protein
MMDKQNEQVDFSNVTFGDFGRLSPAQKVGFLITLPIALPVVALVKFFELFPGSSGVSEVKNLKNVETSPSFLDQDHEQWCEGDDWFVGVDSTRVVGDSQWYADRGE